MRRYAGIAASGLHVVHWLVIVANDSNHTGDVALQMRFGAADELTGPALYLSSQDGALSRSQQRIRRARQVHNNEGPSSSCQPQHALLPLPELSLAESEDGNVGHRQLLISRYTTSTIAVRPLRKFMSWYKTYHRLSYNPVPKANASCSQIIPGLARALHQTEAPSWTAASHSAPPSAEEQRQVCAATPVSSSAARESAAADPPASPPPHSLPSHQARHQS